ncbi:MAG: L-carnitine/gamma-butyrobetaine antiport BCCT transporter [Desulfobacterales bacterium]|nr:L-carnitine/gamma-butyrobetaine antiport BCCT transporter [Desulfobacterales bacterium]
MSQPNEKKQIDPITFFGSIVIITFLCAYLVLDTERGTAAIGKAFGFVTGPLGWSYEWFAMIMAGLTLYLAFGKYGNVRLGDEKPEFSTVSWLGMLFTAGVGSSITYWGTIEFFYYYQSPPFGAEAFSVEAARWASAYGVYHWTVANVVYGVMGVVFGYLFFVKKADVLRPSTACRSVLGDAADGLAGKVIDIFFILGLMAGIATTLGLGTPLISEIVSRLAGIEKGLHLDMSIVMLWTGLIAITVYMGLHKGLQVASNIRVYLTLGLLLFVLVVGPTGFMLNNFTESLGTVCQNFFKMGFYTDAVGKSGFPQGWTIFYWAWWAAFAIQVGVFIARISRGRTIREVALFPLLAISCGCWCFFLTLGNYSLDAFLQGAVPLKEIMAEQGAPAAITSLWQSLPLGKLMIFLFMVVTFLGAVTSLSSAGFTLATVTTKKITGDEEPAKWNRVFWSLALGGAAVTLMVLGGLKPLQTASVVGSLPMMGIIAIIIVGFFKDIKKSHG